MKALHLCSLALLLAACSALGADRDREPLNVVLVLVDDLGWTDLASFGSEYYETPNIDRLAAEGMRFTNAYAAAAICSPTRAAVMTGRSPARLGITDWIRSRFQGGNLPPDGQNPSGYFQPQNRELEVPRNPLWLEREEVTIAETLKSSRYVSCHIGKWHLGLCAWFPEQQGFDFNHGGCDYGQPPSYFDPYFKKRQGDIPTLEPRKEGEYLTDREADEAVRFIREHEDEPFFLYLANYAVHTPLQAKEDLIERYRAKPPTNQKNATYAAMVHSVDDAVGRVLDTLDELGIADRTLVIFSSDNGGLLGPTHNAPLRSGKGYPYEGGIRVPLIVRWPGVVEAGTVSEAPVISMDFLPTVLDACGVAPPEGIALDGISLREHLESRGETSLDRDTLFWHFPHYRGRDVSPYSIVRSGRWKLILWWEGPRVELYDLESDLGETEDLSERRPEKVRELRALLEGELRRVGAKLPRTGS